MAAWIIALHLDELPGAKIKSWPVFWFEFFKKWAMGFFFIQTRNYLENGGKICCCIAFAWVFQGEVNRLIFFLRPFLLLLGRRIRPFGAWHGVLSTANQVGSAHSQSMP